MSLINDLNDVFALLKECNNFIDEVFKNSINSGDSAKLASSGDSAQLASSGDSAKLASSGDSAKLASSGYYAKLASSGYYAQLASSGDYAQLASSGDSAKLASSGYYAQLASSGDSAKLASSGNSAVICATGKYNVAKAKKGTWITLVEYGEKKSVLCVKTEQVDGIKIKEDVYYCLCDSKFCEYLNADGIKCAIISKNKNIYRIKVFGKNKISYLIEKDGVYSHGETIKKAKESLLYKILDRDTSKYKNYTLDTTVKKKEAIELYRKITGACEQGVKLFVERNKIKDKYKIKEIIELTKNEYGNNELMEFFK